MLALLLSRQPRQLTPSTWWIHAVETVCRWAAANERMILAPDGFLHAEFIPFARARYCGEFCRPQVACPLESADSFIAVSVRENGNMLRIGLDAIRMGKEVLVLMPPKNTASSRGNSILIDHGARRFDLPISLLAPQVPAMGRPSATEPPAGFLWHCVRSRDGPWPGQSADDYYASLLDDAPGAAHSPRDALDRILAEGRIRACGRMIRGGYPVVCFSARNPRELYSMRRYKSALLRWDFEPFAVGIRTEAAVAAGVRPVKYLHPDEFQNLGEDERYLFQKHDPPEVDYTTEEEWRMQRDVELNRFASSDLFVYRGGSD